MSRTPAGPPRLCRNCSEPLTGRFCAACGQEDAADLPFGRALRDLAGDLLDLDSRFWLTLKLLVARPGFLSAEYLAGRRARYIAPMRLYLVSSVVFFTAVATAQVEIVHVSGTDPASVSEGVRADSTALAEPSPQAGVPEGGSLRSVLGAAVAAAAAEPGRLNQQFIRALAWVMFVLIPVFALLLKGWFGSRDLLYVHHLVFAFHFHAFGFLTQAIGFAAVRFVPDPPSPGAVLILGSSQVANALYLWLATRRFYGESRARTLGKMAIVGFGYLLAIAAGMVATLAVILLLFFRQP
jgi:hypothetical protein